MKNREIIFYERIENFMAIITEAIVIGEKNKTVDFINNALDKIDSILEEK